jgi:hypothetical protein
MEVRRDNLIVEWEDIGEGISGDYNPDDPDDVELLRFTVLEFHKQSEFGGQWTERDDSSYCTLMPVDTPDEILRRAAELILDAAESTESKRAMEELSWLSPKWFEATDEEIDRSFDAYR